MRIRRISSADDGAVSRMRRRPVDHKNSLSRGVIHPTIHSYAYILPVIYMRASVEHLPAPSGPARLGHRPAHDGAGMRGEEERFAAACRMGAHETLADRREGLLLICGELAKAQNTARIHQRMLGDEIPDLGLGLLIERVIGGPHI